MIPDLMKKVLMIAFIVATTLAADACTAARSMLTKSPPTSDDSWSDSAGGFSQH